MQQSNRPLIIAGVLLAALVVLAGVAVLGNDDVATFDPASPEGVVQTYVEALVSGDRETALALREDTEAGCYETDPSDFRMTLVGTDIRGDSATVDVEISSTGGDPFDTYDYVDDDTFDLNRRAGTWRIVAVPWRFEVCEDPS